MTDPLLRGLTVTAVTRLVQTLSGDPVLVPARRLRNIPPSVR